MEMKEITLEEVAKNLKIREAIERVGEDFYLELPEELRYWNHSTVKKDQDKLVRYGVEIEIPEDIEEPGEIAKAYEGSLNLDNHQYREICNDLQGAYNDLVYAYNAHSLEEDE